MRNVAGDIKNRTIISKKKKKRQKKQKQKNKNKTTPLPSSSSSSSSPLLRSKWASSIICLCQPFLELTDFVHLAITCYLIRKICRNVKIKLDTPGIFPDAGLSFQSLMEMKKAWPNFQSLDISLTTQHNEPFKNKTLSVVRKNLMALRSITTRIGFDFDHYYDEEEGNVGKTVARVVLGRSQEDAIQLQGLTVLACTQSGMSEAEEFFAHLSPPIFLPNLTRIVFYFSDNFPKQISTWKGFSKLTTLSFIFADKFEKGEGEDASAASPSHNMHVISTLPFLETLLVQGEEVWECLKHLSLPPSLTSLSILDDSVEDENAKNESFSFPWELPCLEILKFVAHWKAIGKGWQRSFAKKVPLLSSLTIGMYTSDACYFQVLCQEIEKLSLLQKLSITIETRKNNFNPLLLGLCSSSLQILELEASNGIKITHYEKEKEVVNRGNMSGESGCGGGGGKNNEDKLSFFPLLQDYSGSFQELFFTTPNPALEKLTFGFPPKIVYNPKSTEQKEAEEEETRLLSILNNVGTKRLRTLEIYQPSSVAVKDTFLDLILSKCAQPALREVLICNGNPRQIFNATYEQLETLELNSIQDTLFVSLVFAPLKNLHTLRLLECNISYGGGGGLPPTLTSLHLCKISNLRGNLKSLSKLTRLRSLKVEYCNQLTSLEGIPCSVRYLQWGIEEMPPPPTSFSLECFFLPPPPSPPLEKATKRESARGDDADDDDDGFNRERKVQEEEEEEEEEEENNNRMLVRMLPQCYFFEKFVVKFSRHLVGEQVQQVEQQFTQFRLHHPQAVCCWSVPTSPRNIFSK